MIKKGDYVRLPHYLGEHRCEVVKSDFGGTSLTVRIEPPGNGMGWWLMTVPAAQVKPELPAEPNTLGFVKCINERLFVRTSRPDPARWVEVTNVNFERVNFYSWKDICFLTQ